QNAASASQIPGCATVPASGLLIQTPEGAGEITFLINEVDIRIGSTVFFQAQPNGSLTVSTLQGAARVRAFGTESIAIAGSQVTVPMDKNLAPAGPPSAPAPYDEALLRTLPLGALDKTVVVLPPMTPAEIQADIAAIVGGPGTTTDQETVVSGGGSGSGGGKSGTTGGGTSTTTGDGTSDTTNDTSDTTGDGTSDTSGDGTSDTTIEPTAPPPSDPAAACKNGGWQTMTDGSGNPFKNQGDCVSYFNH
ncbi:MAG TPA: hypothetical protein VHO69_08485, partial [Phototrophicaceae bacterium]|nr:hypothetical protein [Phototrophicaceae bacterium]